MRKTFQISILLGKNISVNCSLQEIELNPKLEESERHLLWNSIFVNTFGETEYIKIISKQCYGLYMALWVHKKYFEAIQDIRMDNVLSAKDFWNSTKGICQGLRFKMMETSICFLNLSLLDSNKGNKAKNQQIEEIFEGLKFGEDLDVLDHK